MHAVRTVHGIQAPRRLNRPLVTPKAVAMNPVVYIVSKQVLTFVFVASSLNYLHYHFQRKQEEKK